MANLRDVHDEHDATYVERGGRRVVDDYGRPDRSHGAVRNVAGVIEHARDVIVVTGEDRIEYVDNAISNDVPTEEGQGVYALLLDPQGRIRTELYVFNAGSRLLVVTPPGEGEPLAEEWAEKTFIQDVEISHETDEFSIFGVHGPKATEKIASVFSETTPETPLSFTRGSMGDTGVTVVRTDGLTGEEGYLVVSAADAGEEIFDTLENRGLNAAPFGYRTWESLTLEAGTPLFESELRDHIPNNLGLSNAIDYDKGCFVGQEVVSRIQNRGQPNKRLIGLRPGAVPEGGAAVFRGDAQVGEVTRALQSPTIEEPIALALVDVDVEQGVSDLVVRIDGEEVAAEASELPFVTGSADSARLPQA